MTASRWAVTTATVGAAPTAANPSSSSRRVEVPGGVATKGMPLSSVSRTVGSLAADPLRRAAQPGGRQGRRQDERERLLADVMAGEVGGKVGGLGDSDLAATVADHGQEVAAVLGGGEVEDEAGMQLAVAADEAGQWLGGQCGKARHRQRPGFDPGHGGHRGAARLHVAQRQPGRADQGAPGGREADPAAHPVEERSAELCLEVAHGDRQGRLAHAGGVGGGGEAVMVDHRHEVGELARIHK